MAKLALVVAALTLTFAGTARAVTYEAEPAFCEPTVLRNFLAPLDRLGDEGNDPGGEQLHFTAAKVSLRPTGPLVVGAGTIGFKLTRPSKLPAIHPGWTVAYHLGRTDWKGDEVLAIDRGTRKIKRLGRGKGGGMRFDVPSKPAPYRLLVRFRARDGRRLGSYSFYFLVVKPFRDSRLALNVTSYQPEQTVFARVENYGTMRTAYGVQYRIERLESGQWTVVPESPDVFTQQIEIGPPGRSGNCLQFWIPPTMPPGHYRMSKEVDGATDVSQATTLTAEFDLLP
jgi:hypothetical protein